MLKIYHFLTFFYQIQWVYMDKFQSVNSFFLYINIRNFMWVVPTVQTKIPINSPFISSIVHQLVLKQLLKYVCEGKYILNVNIVYFIYSI